MVEWFHLNGKQGNITKTGNLSQLCDLISILNHLQNHCLWRKNGQKLILYYLENSKLPTKSSFVEKKRSKLVVYIQKIIKIPILVGHVQCLHQK